MVLGTVGVKLTLSLAILNDLCGLCISQNDTSREPLPPLKYQEGKIPYFEDQSFIRVCASPWTSAVECDPDQGPEQWKQATGYEIEVFRMTMPYIGWTDEMIQFECLSWGDMMLGLENGTCDIAPSGMAPLTERMERGLKFSDHTLQSGIAVMVLADDSSTRNIWYFFSAMSWEVWVAILLTGFVAGVIVWLMEVGSKTLNRETRYLNNVLWDSVGRPVQMRDYRISSVAGNTVAWVWSFTAFIVMSYVDEGALVVWSRFLRHHECFSVLLLTTFVHWICSLYQASLTANMTLQSINEQVTSFADLQGKTVGTWEDYVEDLRPFGPRIVPFAWDSMEDERKMMDALVSGEISALVLDETALRNLDANNCSTKIVEEIQPIKVTGQTAGFANGTATRTVSGYNGALRSLMEDDRLQELRDRFIFVEGAACKDQSVSDEYMRVTWNDVAGLWIILGISVAIGCLVIAFYRTWYHGLRDRLFLRSTVTVGRELSRGLTRIADKNMGAQLEGPLDPKGSGTFMHPFDRSRSMEMNDVEDEDLRTLVRHLRSEVREVKEMLSKGCNP